MVSLQLAMSERRGRKWKRVKQLQTREHLISTEARRKRGQIDPPWSNEGALYDIRITLWKKGREKEIE